MIGYIDYDEALEIISTRFNVEFEDYKLKSALWKAFDKMELIEVNGKGETKNFPRVFEETVPGDIELAQVYEAISILNGECGDDKISSKSINGISVTFNKNTRRLSSDYAEKVMRKYEKKSARWR